ncbi:hypothetical protein AAFF_G00253960 [Aldrovandia affinis]|uniref:C-C motif chemokine n=1 Tax=Aldrovandia affinis TaxID=143900 RepID=A0AAD7W312_9TELE|nr:hypothetical protein AAFF_G00253960 [Aldrovandia affinis]
MKAISLILTTLLLCVLCSLVFPQNINSPKQCCFHYQGRIAPKVIRYERTDQHCAKDAVIFFNHKGAKYCVDPTRKWVKAVMNRVDIKETGSGDKQ